MEHPTKPCFTTIRPTDRMEWLRERQQSLGASDSAGSVGQSRWRTPLKTYLDKVAEEPVEINTLQTRIGNALEPTAREIYQESHADVAVENPTVTHHSNIWPFASANLDGLLHYPDGHDEILEIKTAGSQMAHEWGESHDAIPREYILQACHQMAVTGLAMVRFAVLIGNNDYREYFIARQDDLINDLMEAEAAFWKLVEARTPPNPENAVDVRLRWPQDSGQLREATHEEIDLAIRIGHLQSTAKAANKELEAAKEELELRIGPFAGLTVGGETIVTYKTIERAAYQVKASSYRRLNIK